MGLETGQLISAIIAILLLDLLLDGDNALIIAAMVRHLPQDVSIPWPRWMRPLMPLGRLFPGPIRRLDANQQNAALQVGILGAILGRIALLLIVGTVIKYPVFSFLGAAYLIQLGMRHLGRGHDEEQAEHQAVKLGFWKTVVAVNAVDVAFSLDNVVALVALTRDMMALTIGIAIAVVLMRMAAVIFIRVMKAHPILEPAAYVLVVYLGIQIILEHEGVLRIDEVGKAGALTGIVLAALLYERARFLHPVCGPLFRRLAQAMRLATALLDGILGIALWPFRTMWQLFRPVQNRAR
jgi:tellurite resistance protein TerC